MNTLKAGTIKRIHVNKHTIAANLKHNTKHPTVTIQTSGGSIRCHHAQIMGPSSVADDRGQLGCGARVWIETKGMVKYK